MLDNVLGKRLLEDDEADAFWELLEEVMNREPLYSQNWLAADHLIGRVASQARRFW